MSAKAWWQSATQWNIIIAAVLVIFGRLFEQWPDVIAWLSDPGTAQWLADTGSVISLLIAMVSRAKASQPTTLPLVGDATTPKRVVPFLLFCFSVALFLPACSPVNRSVAESGYRFADGPGREWVSLSEEKWGVESEEAEQRRDRLTAQLDVMQEAINSTEGSVQP